MNSLTRKHVFRQQINQKASVCDKEQTELLAPTSTNNNNNEEKENKKSVTLIKSSGRRAVDTLEAGRLAMHCSVVELNASDEDELATSCCQERQPLAGCQRLLLRQQQQQHKRRSSVAIGYESGGTRPASKSSRDHQATWVGLQQPASGNKSSQAAQMSSRQQSAARQPQQYAAEQQQQSRPSEPARSTVIDDLDRLLVRINLSRRSVSPSESSISTLRAGSPLNRSEFDYSTLCRDEFSNFIPFTAANDEAASLRIDQNSNGFRRNGNKNRPHPKQREARTTTTTKQQAPSKSKPSKVAFGGPMLVGVHSDEASSANHRRSIRPINHHNNHHLLTNHHQDDHRYRATSYDDDNASGQSNDNRCHSNSGGSLDSPEFPTEQLSSEAEIKSSSGCSMSHNGHSLELNRYDDQDDHDGHDDDDRTPPPSGSCSPASKTAYSSESNRSPLATPASSSRSASLAVSVASSPSPSPLCDEHNNEDVDNNGELFDIYVQRVRSLLRLTKGDKSVSMEEAFGCARGQPSSQTEEIWPSEIRVSAEHKTDIEFAPLERANSARVVQELEITDDLMCDENEESAKSRQTLTRATRIVESEFASIISEPNTFPRLNWPSENETGSEADEADSGEEMDERLKQLQRSLVNRLFLESKELLASQSSESDNRLVSTIISHTRDFYQKYTIYQRELKARTSFATDWHKNWLFAFKRPNEDSARQPIDWPSSRAAANYGQASASKRAKMSSPTKEDENAKSVGVGFPTSTTHIDLIEYSTLLLNKHKPIKLNYRVKQTTDDSEMDEQQAGEDSHLFGGYFSAIESCYAAQEEPKSEMYSNSLRSSRQMDVCRQLLQDDDDDDDQDGENDENTEPKKRHKLDSKEQAIRKRGFLVNYKSSVACGTSGDASCCRRNRLFFSAYGYQFEIPLKRARLLASPESAKLDVLKHKVLKRFYEILNSPPSLQFPLKEANKHGEQAKFLVNLTNVELASELPVIQFCAKVCGALPIRVRWFNESNGLELGNTIYSTPNSAHRKSFNVRNCTYWAPSGGQSWPLDLHADYDYEYQTNWLSWHRFRRCRGEIMFEIRNASAELDYNQTYRCVIQNYCSARECSFRLTRRQVDDLLTDKQRRPSSSSSEKRHRSSGPIESSAAPGKTAASTAALLRCWSERTLNKPQPNTTAPRENYDDGDDHDRGHLNKLSSARCAPAKSAVSNFQPEPTATTAGLSKRQQTVGWRSASFAAQAKADDVKHKFGKDFPYHPENLLKRLEENKFSVRVNCNKSSLSSNSNSNNKSELPSPENSRPTTTRNSRDLATNLTTHRMQFADSSFDWPTAQTEQQQQQEQREQQESELFSGFGSERQARSSNLACGAVGQQLQCRLEDSTSQTYEHQDCHQSDNDHDGGGSGSSRATVGESKQRLLIGGGQIQQAGERRTHHVDSIGQLAVDNNNCDDYDDSDYDDVAAATTAEAPKPRPRSKSSSRAIGNFQSNQQQSRSSREDQKLGASSWSRSGEQAVAARLEPKRPPSSGHQLSDERRSEVAESTTKPVASTAGPARAMSSNDNGRDVDDRRRRMDNNSIAATVPSDEPHTQSRPKPNNVKSLISRFSVKG